MQRKRRVAAAGARDAAVQAAAQQRPVRQVGQRVVMRQIEQMAFRALAIGDVDRCREDGGNGVVALPQRRLGRQEDALRSVAVDEFLLVARQRRVRLEHLAIERPAAFGALAGAPSSPARLP